MQRIYKTITARVQPCPAHCHENLSRHCRNIIMLRLRLTTGSPAPALVLFAIRPERVAVTLSWLPVLWLLSNNVGTGAQLFSVLAQAPNTSSSCLAWPSPRTLSSLSSSSSFFFFFFTRICIFQVTYENGAQKIVLISRILSFLGSSFLNFETSPVGH